MWKPLLFIAALATAMVTTAQAAPSREELLATPAWLTAHAGDKDLVILHVGSEAGYAAGHIAGARLVSPEVLVVSTPGGLSDELPPPDVLRKQMQALGISDNSHIVVYNETNALPRVTRVMFTLDAAGFGDRSSLLDGGLAEWKKTGHAVTSEATQFAAGTLAPLKMQPIVVDADYVKAHLNTPGTDLIDARAAMFYGGLIAKVDGDGHIPGARSMPFSTLTEADGKLKSPEELRSMFSKAGVKPGDHVIAYCQAGGQSSAVVFAARTIGLHPDLYDGSFQDWSKRGLPVETSTAPGK